MNVWTVTRKGNIVTVGEIRIGTSGWRYPEWRGEFYPRGLQQRLELQFLSRRLNTVEIHLPALRDRREDVPALNWFARNGFTESESCLHVHASADEVGTVTMPGPAFS